MHVQLFFMFFQIPGFGLAACNLQNDSINWRMTFLLHGLHAHVYSSPEHSLSTMAISNPSLRMTELGQLIVGRIRGQLHTRNPDEYFPDRQLQFLLKADALQRRLYFLWPGVHPVYCIAHSLYDSESVCGCFGGCQFFDSTLEKNKYFVQLQQENTPIHTTASANTHKFQPRKKSSVVNRDEPDCPPLFSTQGSGRNSIYSHQANRRGTLQRQRQIVAGEDSLSTHTGVTHVHTTLMRLSRRNVEDFTDYSSMLTLNRNSLNSLNDKIVETKDDNNERNVTPSSSVESFMSALSRLDSEIEEPNEECNVEPQPVVVPTKDFPNTWASTVTFCPYIISTLLATQETSSGSSPPMVAILCPRYRSHLPSLLPKVSLQFPPDEVPASPVIAKVSVKINLVEKCHMKLTSSVLEILER